MKIYLKLNNVNKNDFVWNLLMYGGLNGRWSEIEDGPQFIPVPEFPEENEQMQRDIADKIKLSYPGTNGIISRLISEINRELKL